MCYLESRAGRPRLAFCYSTLPTTEDKQRPRSKVWRPTSSDAAADDIAAGAAHIDWHHISWSDIHKFLSQNQDRWQESKSAKQHRQDRVPLQAREFYKRAAETDDPVQVKYYNNAAWNIIKQYHEDKHDIEFAHQL